MAGMGMEEVEIHSKSYLVRWVNAKPNHTISYTIQPHKKSINFGIFKHPGHVAGNTSGQTSNIALFPPPSPNLAVFEEDSKTEHAPSTVIDKLRSIGLKQVAWRGRCEPDKVTQGTYEIPHGEAGNYALVFDNTFSKNISKTATFFLLTFPTANASQIQFGAQMHHSQAMAGAMAIASATAPSKSPRLKPWSKPSADSLRKASVPAPAIAEPPVDVALTTMDSASIHTGVLQKRRRKKGQGFAKRFFCLDYSTTTLSYYHDRNSSALRGAIPLALAAIGANAKTREISIDSGAEIWHLRASNQADFQSWKAALEKASRIMQESTTPGDGLGINTEFQTPRESFAPDTQDWNRLETLLSRMSGIRDAVRRLSVETMSSPPSVISPRPGSGTPSGPSTPTDGVAEDYFRTDEKRPFWKRKASTPGAQANVFKRSVSSQLTVPMPGAEAVIRNGSSSSSSQLSMHDHCKAMLHDLDLVLSEFSSLVAESKMRRMTLPMSAISRLSMQSVDSQEYFDAEDNGELLALHSDSEQEASTDNEAVLGDADSATSSDIGDDTSFVGGSRGARSGSLSSFMPPKSKTLQPLPLDPVSRRGTIAAPTIMPPSLIGFLRKNVGNDLSTIAMPVSANEPTSLLQRAAEQLEYSELLNHAAKASSSTERMMFVAAFAISCLSNARVKERSIRKPFNPMLGETFELVREDKGFRFIAEKVCHRPVQLAFHAESADWCFTQSPKPLQKFWGKSSEINTDGKARLVLYHSGEYFSWTAATCFLRNIIAGEKYIEPVGAMNVVNESNGEKAIITFKAKGMFSGRSEDVEVHIVNSHGEHAEVGLDGTWTQSLQRKDKGAPTKHTIWSAGPLVDKAPKHYGMTAFAATLNEVTAVEQDKMAITHSRLRPDQTALEYGQHDDAKT